MTDLEAELLPGDGSLKSSNEDLLVNVALDDLSYFVGPKNSKQILHNINASFVPGEFACLMGPSGSGKTTVLNCILGNASGEIKGAVLVNGHPHPNHFKSIAKLIPQEDVMLSTLTVREALWYQTELVMSPRLSRAAKDARIQGVLSQLSLSGCAETLIGNVESRGISGGERKRTSIALEMLSNPRVLCVDEPTSGLDSKTAEDVVCILKRTLEESSRTCITTIHQPSFRIFSLFDRVVFLSQGRVAYNGPVSQVEEFFGGIGYPTPAKENPADHILRLLQDDGIILDIVDEFNKLADRDQTGGDLRAAIQGQKLESFEKYPTSSLHQMRVLLRRSMYDTVKDKTKFVRLLSVKVAVGLLMGTLWFGSGRPARNEKLFGLMGSIFMLAVTSLMTILAQTIISFPLQRALLIREYKNGSYGLMPYYIANVLGMNIFGMMYTMASVVPIFFMVGLEFTPLKFLYFTSTIIALQAIGNALGLTVGACSADIIEAQNFLAPILAPTMLFSGFLLPMNQAPTYFHFLYRLSFMKDAISALAITEFKNLTFTDYAPLKLHLFKKGDEILRYMDIDPAEHDVPYYIQVLYLWAAAYTIAGYIVIRHFLRRKTA